MNALCETYKDSEGVNRCQALSRDKRCIIQDSMTLHQSLEQALWSPPDCPRGAELRRKVCECSCWSSIVDVFGPMMSQWSSYDDQVAAKLSLLHTMCKRDVVSDFESDFSESSTTQCGLNAISVTLNPVNPLPAGTVITIVGLNGEPSGPVMLGAASSKFLGEITWEPATCSQWCSKLGMCPQSGSANDDSCLARAKPAIGDVTSSRCVRWCDKDAQLTVTVPKSMPGHTTVVISVTMLNPSFSQTPSPLVVSASGSGLYMKPTEIKPISGSGGVLSARTAPVFSEFLITEDPCNGAFDATSNKWRGSCAGMINTLVFSVRPNLELYAGARIVVSGLVRSGTSSWPPPVFRDLPGMLKSLDVEQWESSTGTLTLRVLEGGVTLHAAVVPVGTSTKFALEFEMPATADDVVVGVQVVKPITVDVLRAGSRLDCDFVQLALPDAGVLISKTPDEASFERRVVGSSTCYPGECNTISVTISPNMALSESADNVLIAITGLLGMDNSIACNPPTTCGDPDVTSIPLFDVDEGGCLCVAPTLRICSRAQVLCVERF
jgi:hypothetical protein